MRKLIILLLFMIMPLQAANATCLLFVFCHRAHHWHHTSHHKQIVVVHKQIVIVHKQTVIVRKQIDKNHVKSDGKHQTKHDLPLPLIAD